MFLQIRQCLVQGKQLSGTFTVGKRELLEVEAAELSAAFVRALENSRLPRAP